MRLINLSGAVSVQHPEFGTANVGDDGVFDVSPDLGAALVEQRSQWLTEAEHVAQAACAELLELSDPRKASEVLRSLRARTVALEAVVAELKARTPGVQPAKRKASTKA
jgi:hypothetical protein